MFGKLLKYEFKYVGKWYFGLYIASFMLSILFGVWLKLTETAGFNTNYDNPDSPALAISFVLLTMCIVFIFAGVGIATVIIIVRQFYRNLFSQEGYLTLTLPVSTHSILLSKLTAAIIWAIMSSLVLLISIFLIATPFMISSFDHSKLKQVFDALMEHFNFQTASLYALNLALSSLANILLIYFAICLGQLFNNYRLLLSVVFYFGIVILSSVFEMMFSFYFEGNLDITLIFSLIINVIETVAFYFGSYAILKHKVNLQ